MRYVAVGLNTILFLFVLYLISKDGFQRAPSDIFLEFLVLVTPVVSILALLGGEKQEKWLL